MSWKRLSLILVLVILCSLVSGCISSNSNNYRPWWTYDNNIQYVEGNYGDIQ